LNIDIEKVLPEWKDQEILMGARIGMTEKYKLVNNITYSVTRIIYISLILQNFRGLIPFVPPTLT